ncbi:hypothetical protein [Algoriphagus sp. CAU 1675]|uniref:hypothetical protein n=1 Tax=Algoriphagus sp. CAU 1675 TaxID=3032597 RepID=UPI0023DBDE17|nr:hypothetical protein [Algoriphagus sp. CAU 1675]MDF2156870.1 hypothetical protein [Algoriphagus sp. CAU 1675]
MRSIYILIFGVVLALFTSCREAKAQIGDYNTMVGVTGGTNIGGTVKQFVTRNGAVDLMVYKRWKGWVGALLFEHHMNIREFEGLEWYVGAGVHYGMWKLGKGEPPWVYKSTQDYTAYGVDAIVGLEYNFDRTNFYIGCYWKPAYSFQDFTDLWGDDAAFTLRYSF